MRVRFIVTAIAALLGFAGSAMAQGQTKGWFLGAEAGYSYLHAFNDSGSGSGLQFHASPTHGYAAGANLGYDFGYLSIMADAFWRRHEVNSLFVANGGTGFPALTGVSSNPFGAVPNISGMLDFKVDLLPQNRWTPYVGAGVGAAWTRLGRLGVAGTTIINHTHVEPAYQGLAGVSYELTPKVSLALDYRYFATIKNKFQDLTGAQFTAPYATHNIMLAVTYHFGSPAPRPRVQPVAPAPPPAPVLAPLAPPPPEPRLYLVYFEFDRATLTSAAAATVQQAAGDFKQHGSVRIEVAGYTDLAGTQRYNLALSKRRADAVSAELRRLGVPQGAIDESWHGKENPRVPTPDGVREAQNRRVEITIP